MTALTALREALHRNAFHTERDYLAALAAFDQVSDCHDELVAVLERFMSLFTDDVTDAMSDAEAALTHARGES